MTGDRYSRARSIIKRYTAFSSTPTVCGRGYVVIGWGHRITDVDRHRFHRSAREISREYARVLLLDDARYTAHWIRKLVGYDLSPSVAEALVSFVYDIDLHQFRSSYLLRRLRRRDPNAADELSRWIVECGTVSDVLKERRQIELDLWFADLRLATYRDENRRLIERANYS